MFTYLFATAIQIPVMTDIAQEKKIVNRRPPILLSQGLDQQPISAEQAYGAPFISPCRYGSRMLNSS